jgi:hypothetical protein
MLLLTFEQYHKENWTPELNRAWKNALTTITQQMLRGARVESVSEPKVVSPTKKANIR